MSTQTQPIPTAPAPEVAKRSGPRIAVVVVGAVLALLGTGVAAGGGGLLAVFGGDDTVGSGRHSLSTGSTALVSEVADITNTTEVTDVLGHPRVHMSVNATGPTQGLFVGIGPAKQVDRYLASAPIEKVTDVHIDPFKLDRAPRGGSKRPAPPASQTFWVAQGTGRDAAKLSWKVRDGDYRLVLMNADGSRGVHTHGRVGLTVPHLPAVAWTLVGGGLLLLAGGITAIVLGARTPRRAQDVA